MVKFEMKYEYNTKPSNIVEQILGHPSRIDKAKMQKFGKNGFQKVKQENSVENFNKNITKLIKNFEK
jgi:hypothetical protein